MSGEKKFARLRGAFRNSLVWGVVWGTFGTVVATAMRLSDNISFGSAVIDGLGMGIRTGVIGAISGAAFFAYMIVAYRGKLLSEISWRRFGNGGAIVAGVFVPAFLQTMNFLSGTGLVPWHLVSDDLVLAALFGGITAAGTVIIAQRDEAAHPVTVQELLERMDAKRLAPAERMRVERMRARDPQNIGE